MKANNPIFDYTIHSHINLVKQESDLLKMANTRYFNFVDFLQKKKQSISSMNCNNYICLGSKLYYAIGLANRVYFRPFQLPDGGSKNSI